MLCSFWSGDGHKSSYASRDNTQVNNSSLAVLGFTQPDKLATLLTLLMAYNDGLLDR